MIDAYFFDSYAIIEILKGNENYSRFRNSRVITTKLNLFEVFYALLRDGLVDEKRAEPILSMYYKFSVDFDAEIIKEASRFKLMHKKSKLSMTDCVGYIIAKRYNIRFLTGDKEFEEFDNVEYVK